MRGAGGDARPRPEGDRATGQRAATMIDVAREAGVSRAAVSKVIRNAYGVSTEMRERVEAAIQRLNYRPSMAARAIRGASFTIGFQLHELENPTLARMLKGAAHGIDGSGYRLVVAPSPTSNLRDSYEAVEALVDLHVDGIVAVAAAMSPEWLEQLAARVPLVMIARHDEAAVGYDTVTGDDTAGARLALEHLLSLGHRKITHLTFSEELTSPGRRTPLSARLHTYRAFMTEQDLGQHAKVCRSAAGEHDAYLATRAILTERDLPTAIFAANDELALGALRAIQERGLSPSDISVAGYDDIPIASHPGLSLTTVDQHADELGRRAVSLLLERIQGRTEARHESTSPHLRIRESTAPPRVIK